MCLRCHSTHTAHTLLGLSGLVRVRESPVPSEHTEALCGPSEAADKSAVTPVNTVSLTISFSHCDCTAHLVAVPPPVWGCCGVRRQPVYPFALPVGPRLCPVASSFLTAQPLTTIPPFLCWRRPRRLASLIEANYLGVDLEIIRNPLSLCHIPCMPDPSQRMDSSN